LDADLGAVNMAVDKAGVHRRRPSLSRLVLAQWPYLTVLVIAAAGLAVVASDHFKRGTTLLAGAICVAALLRAVLPRRAVGWLHVRGRLIDVLTLTVLGIATLIAALVVPPPS
jgi:hypothetical protein